MVLILGDGIEQRVRSGMLEGRSGGVLGWLVEWVSRVGGQTGARVLVQRVCGASPGFGME